MFPHPPSIHSFKGPLFQLFSCILLLYHFSFLGRLHFMTFMSDEELEYRHKPQNEGQGDELRQL
jgi:hypothetical protein